MNVSITCEKTVLNVHVEKIEGASTCILFLCGGSTDTGKERFLRWQEDFKQAGISSVSFDYSGVNGSGLSLEQSSLQGRVKESACAADWMRENIPARQYVLYGVSMGGYIALGLVNGRPEMFSKLILHAPAAYTTAAHKVLFGENFTHEIRKQGSWKDSSSFNWFGEYKKPTLLIEAENDQIVPKEITKTYKSLKLGQSNFESLLLKNTEHDIWGDIPGNIRVRKEVYKKILGFIGE